MPDTIKLTLRQKIFLMKLVEFFGYSRKPVHHTELAKALGLSNSTTYDMLKLLESKGVLYPIFAMPKNESERHGRSRIMFVPTEKIVKEVYQPLGGKTADREELQKYVIRIMERLGKDGVYAGDMDDLYGIFSVVAKEEPSLAPQNGSQKEADEWEELKEHILTTIRRQRKPHYVKLLYELMTLTSVTSSPLARSSEVILAILLNIRSARYKFNGPNPLQMLLEAPVTKERMILLAGLAWGLLVPNPKVQQLLGDLGKNIQVYEESINRLTPEELMELHKFTREVWQSLDEHTPAAK
jgi:DNA-binding MarR family transcriptional regulator